MDKLGLVKQLGFFMSIMSEKLVPLVEGGHLGLQHDCELIHQAQTAGVGARVSRASQRNALLIQHCHSPYRTTQLKKTIKNRQKGPILAIKGPFGDLGGPRRALGGQIWSQRPPIGQSGLESCSPHTLTWYGAPSGSLGALKETVLA